MNKKLRAFTLPELIIVILVSSILIGSVYTIFSLSEKHFIFFQENSSQFSELLMLSSSIQKDMDKASLITSTGNILNFIYYEGNIETYQLEKDMIISSNNSNFPSIDTFRIKTDEYSFSSLQGQDNVINHIRLYFNIGGEIFPFQLYKKYTNRVVFNLSKQNQ